MLRRSFLKLIGVGAAAGVLPASAVAKEVELEEVMFPSTDDWGKAVESVLLDEEGSTLLHTKNMHIALFTTELTADGLGDEVSYNGYERQPVTMKIEDGYIANVDEIVFPTVTDYPIHANPLNVVAVGFYDDENMLFYSNLDSEVYLHTDDSLTFQQNNLNISMY